MSLSFQPIRPVCVRDPVTMLEHERTYAVLKSGSQTTWKPFTTTSISSSSLQFSCPPPATSVIVDRKIYLYCPVRLTFTGSPLPGTPLLRANQDAPRAFPLNSSIDTFSSTINNQSVSINIADIIHALMHYNTPNELKNLDYSNTPSYQDQSQNYADLFGSIRSPLANYGDANDGNQCPRGGYPYTIVQNPPPGVSGQVVTAIVDVAFCEPIFLPPYYFGGSNGCGFFNVNTMDFNITFLGNAANRMWSHDFSNFGATIDTASMVFGGVINGPVSGSFPNNRGNQPMLLIKYITPQENMIIPNNVPITYPYFDVLRFPTDLAQSMGGASGPVTYNSNNIQLNSVPRRLYIFIRERNSDLFSSTSKTDTFFQINQISLQFQNKNGLLASASMDQLYGMCVKNHCKMSWNQWSGGPVISQNTPNIISMGAASYYGTIGSVVCIEFATDIGLDSLQAPGVLAQCQLQVQVNATNVSGRTISPTLYIVTVMEGTFTIQGAGMASTNVGVITPTDILDCQEDVMINYADVESVNGGDFWSGLKDFGSKLFNVLGKVHNFVKGNKLVSRGLSLVPDKRVQAASFLANALGYGEGDGGDGGVLVGGRHMSRKNLHNRIKKY